MTVVSLSLQGFFKRLDKKEASTFNDGARLKDCTT